MSAVTHDLSHYNELKREITRFMMMYKFALDEMNTKINILKQEFTYIHDYNPIEHVKSRLKSPESIVKKVKRKNLPLTLDSVKENIHDIAGIRITCSFQSDIYEISRMLSNQKDVKVIRCKDYIKNPKPNGYQSLHLIVQVPVFLTDREEDVSVEIQIRTIAMDFWASLEHKIYYKYNKEVPKRLLDELKEAAQTVSQLDKKMESIQKEVNKLKAYQEKMDHTNELVIDEEKFTLPFEFMTTMLKNN